MPTFPAAAFVNSRAARPFQSPSSGTKEHDASRGDAAVADRLVPELTVDGSPEAIATVG